MAANRQNTRPGQYYPGGQYPGTYAPISISNADHAAMYSTVPGTQWAQQLATSYAGHPSYTAASSYGDYYRSGSQSEAKPAESHASSQLLGFNNSYSASYAGECYGSHSSSGMMLRSPFQSSVQRGSSTLGSMSARTRSQEVHYVPPRVLHTVRSLTNLDASMQAILVLDQDEVRPHQDTVRSSEQPP
jgi:hypothetical protein